MEERPAPYAEYLADIDILYVCLKDEPVNKTREGANIWVNIDHAADGSVVAVEVVDAANRGVDLSGVPERETVERLIREAEIVLPRPART